MRMSIFPPTLSSPVHVGAALFLCSVQLGLAAENGGCLLHELPRTNAVHPYVYSRDNYKWKITVDELTGRVQVDGVSSKKSCVIELQSVKRVYGGHKLLALRSIEITSDDLFFFNPATCSEVRKAVHLGVSSESAKSTVSRLRRIKICELSQPMRSEPARPIEADK
jgi:hypothetical protein